MFTVADIASASYGRRQIHREDIGVVRRVP
jgi:hypothetical protein